MSRLAGALSAARESERGRLRPAALATLALLLGSPLGIAACGGTSVTEKTPGSTPEITAPREAEGETSATTKKSKSHTSLSTTESTEAGEEESFTEETPETGGTESTEEEVPTGGEEAPPEEEAPAEEEAEGATGGASAP